MVWTGNMEAWMISTNRFFQAVHLAAAKVGGNSVCNRLRPNRIRRRGLDRFRVLLILASLPQRRKAEAQAAQAHRSPGRPGARRSGALGRNVVRVPQAVLEPVAAESDRSTLLTCEVLIQLNWVEKNRAEFLHEFELKKNSERALEKEDPEFRGRVATTLQLFSTLFCWTCLWDRPEAPSMGLGCQPGGTQSASSFLKLLGLIWCLISNAGNVLRSVSGSCSLYHEHNLAYTGQCSCHGL